MKVARRTADWVLRTAVGQEDGVNLLHQAQRGRYLSTMRAALILASFMLSVAAAASAQSPAPAPAPAPQMTVDSATRTVTFDLIAGATTENASLNFNGYKAGRLIFTAPRGWTVVFEFTNR